MNRSGTLTHFAWRYPDRSLLTIIVSPVIDPQQDGKGKWNEIVILNTAHVYSGETLRNRSTEVT